MNTGILTILGIGMPGMGEWTIILLIFLVVVYFIMNSNKNNERSIIDQRTTMVNAGTNMNNQTPPKSWLVESILVTIFCCMPFGIVGIVYASKVESRFSVGDYEGALRASMEAKKWTIIGFVLTLVGGILYFLFF